MQEKQFIQKGARKVKLHEFLQDELEGAGYSNCEIQRTPTSTKIVVYAQRPGLVIGRGGSRIRELTDDMEDEFDFENPQIEVNEIENGDGDAKVVAESIASWLEKGGHVKRVGYTYIRRMKESGVIGAELEITGKLSGNRGRTEKFSFGYVKRCGDTSKKNVQKGYKLARTKPGAIGVKVRIMKEMPEFMHRDVDVGKEILHESTESEKDESKAERIDQIVAEADNMTSAEIERAVEDTGNDLEEITKSEIRQAFEDLEEAEEDEAEEETETEEPDSSEESETAETEESDDSEEDSSEVDYDEIVSGTIADAKDAIDDLETVDFEAAIEAEENGKNRTTFVDWLEGKA